MGFTGVKWKSLLTRVIIYNPTYNGYNPYKVTFRNSFLEQICPKQMVMLVILRKPSSMAKRVECITSSSCSAHSWGILLAFKNGNWVWIGGWYSNHQIVLGVFKILQIFFCWNLQKHPFLPMAVDWMIFFWVNSGTLRTPSLNSMWKYIGCRMDVGRMRPTPKASWECSRLWCLLSQKIWVQSTLSLTSDGSKKTGSVSFALDMFGSQDWDIWDWTMLDRMTIIVELSISSRWLLELSEMISEYFRGLTKLLRMIHLHSDNVCQRPGFTRELLTSPDHRNQTQKLSWVQTPWGQLQWTKCGKPSWVQLLVRKQRNAGGLCWYWCLWMIQRKIISFPYFSAIKGKYINFHTVSWLTANPFGSVTLNC